MCFPAAAKSRPSLSLGQTMQICTRSKPWTTVPPSSTSSSPATGAIGLAHITPFLIKKCRQKASNNHPINFRNQRRSGKLFGLKSSKMSLRISRCKSWNDLVLWLLWRWKFHCWSENLNSSYEYSPNPTITIVCVMKCLFVIRCIACIHLYFDWDCSGTLTFLHRKKTFLSFFQILLRCEWILYGFRGIEPDDPLGNGCLLDCKPCWIWSDSIHPFPYSSQKCSRDFSPTSPSSFAPSPCFVPDGHFGTFPNKFCKLKIDWRPRWWHPSDISLLWSSPPLITSTPVSYDSATSLITSLWSSSSL